MHVSLNYKHATLPPLAHLKHLSNKNNHPRDNPFLLCVRKKAIEDVVWCVFAVLLSQNT